MYLTSFFLSGYGLMVSLQNKGIVYFDNFFMKRLSKLFIPVLIITLIYWGILALVGDFSWHLIGKRLVAGYGTSPKSWFIFALLTCYVTFFVAFRWIKNIKYGLVLVWLFTLVLMLCTSVLHWSLWTLSLVSFPMGVSVAFVKKYNSTFFCRTLITAAILCCLYGCYGCHIHSLPGWWFVASNAMPLAVYFAFRKIDISGVCFLSWLDNYSFEIYLLHGVVLYFAAEYIGNPWILLVTMVVIVLILAPIYSNWTKMLVSKISGLFV